MTTTKRLYSYNGVPTNSFAPATNRGAWDAATAAILIALVESALGASAAKTIAETSATNNYDVMVWKGIADTTFIKRAGQFAGTFKWALHVLESSANANMFTHLHVYVLAGDTDVLRGTLITDVIGTTEWPTTAAGLAENTYNVTPVAVQPGDRLVVEAGYQAQNTVTTSYSGTIRYGGATKPDLTTGATATGMAAWFDFIEPSDVTVANPAQDTAKAYVKASTAKAQSAGSATVVIPASAAGDAQIMVVFADDALVLATPPSGSGWVAVGAAYSASAIGKGQVYRRVSVGTDGTTSEVWTGAGGSTILFPTTIGTADASSDALLFDVLPTWQTTTPASATATAPAVTPSATDSLALVALYDLVNNNGGDSHGSITNMAQQQDVGDTATPYISGALYSQQLTTNTSTGTRPAATTQTSKSIGMQCAIRTKSAVVVPTVLYPFLHAGS